MAARRASPPPLALSDDDRRAIAAWTADCAARVLPLFEARVDDPRLRDALAAIRVFARDGVRTAALRTAALAALAAARDAGDPIATAAARAAGLAASSAYIHAHATLDQAKHILCPPAYAAQAAGDDEIAWAIEHAPPAVRDVLRRMPARAPGRGRLDALLFRLDAALRA